VKEDALTYKTDANVCSPWWAEVDAAHVSRATKAGPGHAASLQHVSLDARQRHLYHTSLTWSVEVPLFRNKRLRSKLLVRKSAPVGIVEAVHVWLVHHVWLLDHTWLLQHALVLHHVVGSMSHHLRVVLALRRDILHLMLILAVLAILDLLVVVNLLTKLVMLHHTTCRVSHQLLATTHPVNGLSIAATDMLRISSMLPGQGHDVVFSFLTCHLCQVRRSLLWQDGLEANHLDSNVRENKLWSEIRIEGWPIREW
jgi:hypothetical protein